jgi:lysophospholipase L1-like esterase
MIKNIKWLLLVSISFVACNKTDDEVVAAEVPLTAGSANFSKYVALGNSLTAGFSDNALFKKGQQNSYPSLLSKQFAQVGGGTFNIPFCGDDNLGGLLLGGNPIQGTRLYFNGVAPVNVSGTPQTEVGVHLLGTFNNLGVPGAKSFHLLAPGYGNIAGVATGAANPYFVRFASSPTTTILADAVAQSATFFSLWIGNNDVLSYATSGGTGVNQLGNTNPATYGSSDITDPTVFANTYGALVNGLTAGNAKGVVANLPYVTTIPYFTTVPTNPIPALPAASATSLNQLLGGINQITTALSQSNRFVTLSADDNNPLTVEPNNPLLIIDETLPDLSAQITSALTPLYGVSTAGVIGSLYGRARHARATGSRDYVLLTARGIIGTAQPGYPASFATRGVSYPLQDAAVLTADEALQIKTATDLYNISIKSIAETKGLAFLDANSLLTQVANGGVRFGNYHLSSNYVTGGGFSLDGVHPSSRGYALIANKFLEAINAKYGSTFRPIDLGNYSIQYPASL